MPLAGLIAQMRAGGVVVLLVSSSGTADVLYDRVEIIQTIDGLVVEVYRVRGIGDAELKMPGSEWPAAVIVRLHGFQELESFTAASKTARLDCALIRPEGQHAVQSCRVDDDRIDALRREPDYFEVELPRAIFPSDGDGIEIRWVDQWR